MVILIWMVAAVSEQHSARRELHLVTDQLKEGALRGKLVSMTSAHETQWWIPRRTGVGEAQKVHEKKPFLGDSYRYTYATQG